MIPSLVFHSRIDSIVSSTDRMKQALACIFGVADRVPADVEPDRRIERRHLVKQDEGQLRLERVAVLLGGEVAALASPAGDRAGHAADHLLDRTLTSRRSGLAAEVLLGDDVRRVLRPRLRKLDVALLEGDLVAVADARIPQLPLDRLERMLPRRGEKSADRESLPRVLSGGELGLRGVLHTDLLLSLFRSLRAASVRPDWPRG